MDARVRELFDRLCDLPLADRQQLIDQECGEDREFRAEVQSLLAAHQDAGPFMSEPTADWSPPLAETTLTAVEQVGAIIGRYKLLEKIGEGGFGVVYMAQQSEPIRRRVALKIIKLGMDTQQVVARFEAERQALALMDHPNIARVIDGGATETGRPYFVMELVRGDPITVYCDRQRLTMRERLELFKQVCLAIQHAHQKGVIHRDIKPSNVLVTISDDKPLVKVIDFGIAKATNTELTSKTLFTEFRALIGTPAYMSPEQAERSGVDIDTRSDIYSLGVLLYEMLTGRTPIDPQVLGSAVWGELQRIICEQEPQRPSMLLASTQGELADIAQRRSTEPTRLGGLLKGDLDWIVLKSLEKDRSRRYATAEQFAADIERYLHDEPVEAMPPSRVYQLSKFAKRNRALIVSTAAVLLALVLGLVGTTFAMLVANNARERAVVAEEAAQQNARRARLAATLAGTAQLPDDETKELVAAWKEDLDQQSKTLAADDPNLISQRCQYATWYGRWLLARGRGKEAKQLIQNLYEPAKQVLGTSDAGFLSLCNVWIQTNQQLGASAQVIESLYVDLMQAIGSVHGPEAAILMLPEYAIFVVRSGDSAKAAGSHRTLSDRASADWWRPVGQRDCQAGSHNRQVDSVGGREPRNLPQTPGLSRQRCRGT